jgi:hypothetical protein
MFAPDSGLTPMDRSVYIAYDLYTDEEGFCFPSQKTIAAMIGTSERTIRSAVSNLERGGWIVIEHRRGGGNRYHLPYRANRKSTSDSKSEIGNTLPVISGGNGKQASGQIGNTLPVKWEAGFRLRRANEGEPTNKSQRGRARFVPPTLDEIKVFCQENSLSMDPEEYFDHYQGNGWVQGQKAKPIVDWKATVRNWARREKKFNGNGKPKFAIGPGQRHPADFVGNEF